MNLIDYLAKVSQCNVTIKKAIEPLATQFQGLHACVILTSTNSYKAIAKLPVPCSMAAPRYVGNKLQVGVELIMVTLHIDILRFRVIIIEITRLSLAIQLKNNKDFVNQYNNIEP